MRENRPSGSEGGGIGLNRSFLPLSSSDIVLGMRKFYILDSNILLHDPNSIMHFADNVVIIPIEVIIEIDRFKHELSNRRQNAREVSRLLDQLRGSESLAAGVGLPNGGLLRVYCARE